MVRDCIHILKVLVTSEQREAALRAHQNSKGLIYPGFFDQAILGNRFRWHSTPSIEYYSSLGNDHHAIARSLDWELGIDVEATFPHPAFSQVRHSFQERHLNARTNYYRTLTMTVANPRIELAEFQKITAQFFVAAYYDYESDLLVESVVISVPRFQHVISRIPHVVRPNLGNQTTFLIVHFDTLFKHKLVESSYRNPDLIGNYEEKVLPDLQALMLRD